MVLKIAPNTPNVYCNVGLTHYVLGHDNDGRQFLNTCYQKDPNPQTSGYNETEVRKVLFARQPRRKGCGVYNSDARQKTPLDREREYQQNVYESLRNSAFNGRAEPAVMIARSARE